MINYILSHRICNHAPRFDRGQKRFKTLPLLRIVGERTVFDQLPEGVQITCRREGGSDPLGLRPENLKLDTGQGTIEKRERRGAFLSRRANSPQIAQVRW